MKKTKILLATLLALATVFALCACSVEFGGEENWEYKADDKEGTEELYNNFFEKTNASTNTVVTISGSNGVISVESIDGTSDFQNIRGGETQAYSFVKDGEYYYAVSSSDSNYYMTGKENYDMGYNAYKNYIEFFDAVPEGDGVTYSCVVNGNKNKDGESSATMTLEIDAGAEGKITMTATAKNDLVESLTFTSTSAEEGVSETFTISMSFVYGSASVTIPDVSGWSKVEY